MYFSVTDKYITDAQDTIYKIANKFYFKWWLWRIIYDYNKKILGDDPWTLPAGKKIEIIGLNTEDIIHTIKAGDTWVNLSAAYYGSEAHFVDIARANEYKHLIAGETAVIPALVTAKDIDNARQLRNVCA